MKPFVFICVAMLVAMAFVTAPASAGSHRHCSKDDGGIFRDNDVDVEFENGSLVFDYDDDDETVEITEDYRLIVNGDEVHLDRSQQRLVKEYRIAFDRIIEEAKDIGVEGAKIGVNGAGLGIAAVVGVLKLLSDDYDENDLEEDMDRKASKLERKAEKLERRAQRLEDRVERLESLHENLRESVDELDRLGWF